MIAADEKYICVPRSDTHDGHILYVLKPKPSGTMPLFAIGMNPSDSNEHRLDQTVENVKRFTEKYAGCDHFVMLNLCPQRQNIEQLPEMLDDDSLDENIAKIKEELSLAGEPTIFACWGNILDNTKKIKEYLLKSVLRLFDLPEVQRAKWVRIKTKEETLYPMNPSNQNLNLGRFTDDYLLEEWKSCDVGEYIEKLRKPNPLQERTKQ